MQSIRPLPYDGQLKVTTAKYYTPSGRCVQAIDYSHRNEDGSVGHIPDSLTHAFKTVHGRTVRDGGGITPDFEVKAHKYSRLTYSIVLNGIVDQYAMKYVREHEALPTVEDFHFDAYDDFVAFAKDKEFDYRSSARALFDEMKKVLAEDGLTGTMSGELAAMEKSLDMDKETFLRLKKDEIVRTTSSRKRSRSPRSAGRLSRIPDFHQPFLEIVAVASRGVPQFDAVVVDGGG